jgi:biotin transporter BioY
MYIIAIGWLWVALMMAITETSIVAGVLSFTFYGLLPCALLMWLLGTPARRARQRTQDERAGTGSSDEPPPPRPGA